MNTNAARLTSTRTRRAGRTAGAVIAAVVGMGGLAACSDDSAGPEAGGVSVEDLQGVEDQVAGLDERIGALEEGLGADVGADVGADAVDPLGADDDTEAFFGDNESYVGQEVTVSAEVSEMVTTTDIGSSFRIAGESGDPIAVISASPPAEMDANDVVQVSGTVVQVQRDTFEEDFGLASDDLFEDADAFFEEEEGSIAISADRIEVLQEQGQND
ncbi:hypothetical protein [Blastococcus saxobsidens]|uniref:Uncharacterized protein n=1 Tax=Blastococcus saxobsidens (strain DD2) TaxID=1146883 RepID=H6RN99_BLASD|nr:hypothetical protein [Blastococcus saxobsidens]CCG02647.1 exported protein of unknown function [Blastococcus saxobsidens DD2]